MTYIRTGSDGWPIPGKPNRLVTYDPGPEDFLLVVAFEGRIIHSSSITEYSRVLAWARRMLMQLRTEKAVILKVMPVSADEYRYLFGIPDRDPNPGPPEEEARIRQEMIDRLKTILVESDDPCVSKDAMQLLEDMGAI